VLSADVLKCRSTCVPEVPKHGVRVPAERRYGM